MATRVISTKPGVPDEHGPFQALQFLAYRQLKVAEAAAMVVVVVAAVEARQYTEDLYLLEKQDPRTFACVRSWCTYTEAVFGTNASATDMQNLAMETLQLRG